MDMPKSCFECGFYQNEMDYCEVTDTDYPFLEELKLKDCPLAEIPTPHGRLIDADVLLAIMRKRLYGNPEFDYIIGLVERQRTIIEAEE